MIALLRRLRARIRYRNFDRDLRDEIDDHRAMAARDAGPDAPAHRVARLMGNTTLAREEARAVWITPWIDGLRQDAVYAVRTLRAAPGYTVTALLILTVGIGLNTTLFAIANGMLGKPWALPEPETLVTIFQRQIAAADGRALVGVPAAEFTYLRDHATTVAVTASREAPVHLEAGAIEISVTGRFVSGNYFGTLRAPVALGRQLDPHDDRPGAANVVVLSHHAWQTTFGGDGAIVGRIVHLNRVPFTVTGVAVRDTIESPLSGSPALWVPLSAMAAISSDGFSQRFLTSPTDCCVRLAGRITRGNTRDATAAELSVLDQQFRSANGIASPADRGIAVRGTAAIDQPESRRMVPVFGLLFAGVALVLLLACANVGNLQLARALSRTREFAIRLSLGAGRTRVVRQLLTEGLVLSVVAAALSLAMAAGAARLLRYLVDDATFRALDLRPDYQAAAVAFVLAGVATLLSGLAPALRVTRRIAAGRYVETAGRTRLRGILLAAQVAIGTLLLVTAGLVTRGTSRAALIDPGFTLTGVTALAVDAKLGTNDERQAFRLALLSEFDSLAPATVAVSALIPLGDSHMRQRTRQPGAPEAAVWPVSVHEVSAGYFGTLGMRMVEGRPFHDDASNEIVVNETLARRVWSSPAAAIGQTLPDVNRRVVGVVADARLETMNGVEPTLFEPLGTNVHYVIVTGPANVERVRALIARLRPKATIDARPLADNIERSLEEATIGARLAGGLGILALALSAAGIFGVFSYVVTERTREIGLRLAIGARRVDVLRVLLRRAAIPLGVGLGIGLAASGMSGAILESKLYGLSPLDPVAYAGVLAVIAFATLCATLLPALRALRVDPAVALRTE